MRLDHTKQLKYAFSPVIASNYWLTIKLNEELNGQQNDRVWHKHSKWKVNSPRSGREKNNNICNPFYNSRQSWTFQLLLQLGRTKDRERQITRTPQLSGLYEDIEIYFVDFLYWPLCSDLLMCNYDNCSIGPKSLSVPGSTFKLSFHNNAVPNHSFLPSRIVPPPQLCQQNCLWNCNLNWIAELIWIKNNIYFGGDRAWERATGGRKGPTEMGGERVGTQ